MLQNYIDIYRGIHVLPTFKQLFESIQLFWDRDVTEVSIHRCCGHFVSCQKINSYLRSLQGLTGSDSKADTRKRESNTKSRHLSRHSYQHLCEALRQLDTCV